MVKAMLDKQVLLDFEATLKAKPNLSDKELLDKFPEFKNDTNLLNSAYDYHATVKSGKYKTESEIDAHFPEFFGGEQQTAQAKPKGTFKTYSGSGKVGAGMMGVQVPDKSGQIREIETDDFGNTLYAPTPTPKVTPQQRRNFTQERAVNQYAGVDVPANSTSPEDVAIARTSGERNWQARTAEQKQQDDAFLAAGNWENLNKAIEANSEAYKTGQIDYATAKQRGEQLQKIYESKTPAEWNQGTFAGTGTGKALLSLGKGAGSLLSTPARVLDYGGYMVDKGTKSILPEEATKWAKENGLLSTANNYDEYSRTNAIGEHANYFADKGQQYGLATKEQTVGQDGKRRFKDFTDYYKAGDFSGAAGDLFRSGLTSLPQSAIGMVAPELLWVTSAPQFTDKYKQLEQNNPELSEKEKVTNATIGYLGEVLSEHLGGTLDNVIYKGMVKQFGEGTAKKILEHYGMQVATGTVGEGLEEGFSGGVGQLADINSGVQQGMDWKGLGKQMAYGAAGGFSMTGGMALPAGIETAANKRNAQKFEAERTNMANQLGIENTPEAWQALNEGYNAPTHDPNKLAEDKHYRVGAQLAHQEKVNNELNIGKQIIDQTLSTHTNTTDGKLWQATLYNEANPEQPDPVSIVSGNVSINPLTGQIDAKSSDAKVGVLMPDGTKRVVDLYDVIDAAPFDIEEARAQEHAILENNINQKYSAEKQLLFANADDAAANTGGEMMSTPVGEQEATGTVLNETPQQTQTAIPEIGQEVSYQGQKGIVQGFDSENQPIVAFETPINVDGRTVQVTPLSVEKLDRETEKVQTAEQPQTPNPNNADKQAFYSTLPLNPKGEVEESQLTPEQHIQYAEYEIGKDGAKEIAYDQSKSLSAQIAKLDKQPKTVANIKAKQQLSERKTGYDGYIANITATTEADKAQQEAMLQGKTDRLEAGKQTSVTGQGFDGITSKWQAAPKVEGFTDEMKLANGEVIPGKYVLTEQGAFTPSHDVNKNFASTEGFPSNERGENINDRDYQNDQAAQQVTVGMSQNYDRGAIGIVVDGSTGVTVSGNGRTMAGQLAAQNGTDAAYNDYINRYAANYGFTPEQVSEMQHPRIVFVPDAKVDLTTENFKKFNADEKKSQSNTEKAKAQAKSLNAVTIGKIAEYLNGVNNLSEVYNDANRTAEMLSILITDGVIQDKDTAQFLNDNGTMNGTGRDFLESTMLGAAFAGKANDIAQVMKFDETQKAVIFKAIPQIIENSTLGAFDVTNYLSEAIAIVNKANAAGTSVEIEGRQLDLINGAHSEQAINLAMALVIDDKRETAKLRKIFEEYNNSVRDEAKGGQNMFGDRNPKEVLTDVLKLNGLDLALNSKGKINSVIDSDKDTSKGDSKEVLFVVPDSVSEKIKEVTGIDVTGYKYTIDKSGANHAIKRHSNAKTEESRGQIPLTQEDFERIPEILSNPDNVKGIGKNKIGQETIVFDKKFEDGTVIVYEAVLTGKKELSFSTMFKKRIDEFMAEAPTLTPETTSDSLNKDTQSSDIKQVESENSLLDQVNTNPTEAQKEAGNYKKAHIKVQGMDITVENPKGSERSGKDEDGNAWAHTMQSHYGYFKRTEGKDGDHIDVFVGENPEAQTVFVIDQNNPSTGAFDESKVMVGYNTAEEAKAAYLENYDKDWKGFGSITQVPVPAFKTWLYDGAKQRKPFAEYVGTQNPVDIARNDENLAENPKTSKAAMPSSKTEKIEDFGEKILGAKKELFQENKATQDDIISMPLSKSFPKPDFASMVESGLLSEDGSIALSYLYDNIPNKPRGEYKVKRWAVNVQSVINAFNQILSNPDFEARIISDLRSSAAFNNYNTYEATLKAFGFPKETVNLGAYEVKQFKGREGYSIVKGNYIIKDCKTIEEAVSTLKELIEKNKAKSKETKFDIYKDTKTNKFFIGKKGATKTVRLISDIETLEEARKIHSEQKEQIQALWDALKIKVNERRSTNSERVGTDYRNRIDVTVNDFEQFGFRGVQFGNWVNNNERQQSLNEAFDALMDLATTLGISPKAISLNGELGLAFGARGSGTASAHYESGQVVINLTKTKGSGSLAHEWWHALDSYFSRMRGEKLNFITENPRQKRISSTQYDNRVRKEVIDAYKEIVDLINKSGLRDRSERLDMARSTPYWSTNIEMTARAFENYIVEKLGASKERNDYLANFKETSEWINDDGLDMETYPYPKVDESPEINKAIQKLFDTIQEGENGMLFQISNVSEKLKPITQQFFDKIVGQLNKAFPNTKVIVNNEAMKAYLEKNAGVQVNYMATSKGEVYGFTTPEGNIYIDASKLNANTPIHEFGHLWNSIAMQTNPDMWAKIIDLCKQTTLWKELENNPAYAHLKTDDQKADEVFATLLGNRGENNAEQLLAASNGDIKLFVKLNDIIRKFWAWLKETLYGIKPKMKQAEKGESFIEANNRFQTTSTTKAQLTADINAQVDAELKALDKELAAKERELRTAQRNIFTEQQQQLFAEREKQYGLFDERADVSDANQKRILDPLKNEIKRIKAEKILTQAGRQKCIDEALKAHDQQLTLFQQIGNKVDKEFDSSTIAELQEMIDKALGQMFGGKALQATSNNTKEEISKQSEVQYADQAKYDFDVTGITAANAEAMQAIKDEAMAAGTYMQAPNGKKTQLTDRQWLQVRTPEFKAWFGDWINDSENASKVVDENGEPMVVYHGTNAEFTKFKNKGSYNGIKHKGYFFGDEKTAGMFYNNNTISAYLKIINPYTVDVDNEIHEYEDEYPDELKKKWRGETIGDFETGRSAVAYFDDNIDRVYEYAEDYNSDGIIVYGTDGSLNIVAFNANQIKSTIDNNGNFDEASDDIRFQIIGEKGAANLEESERVLDDLRVAKEMEEGKGIQEAQTMYFNQIPDALKEDARIVNRGEDANGEAMARIQTNPEAKAAWADYIRAQKQLQEWKTLSAKEQAQRIRLATGWEKGVDGLWRYEIPDIKGINKEVYNTLYGGENYNTVKLSELIGTDNELLKSYPQLKEIDVARNNINGKGTFSPSGNGQITINEQLTSLSAKSTLIHEIQHAIQEIEGFAKGGNTNMFSTQEYFNKAKELDLVGKDYTDEEIKRRIYNALAGETEARNASARMGMTEAQRRNTLLAETADVAPASQIVIRDAVDRQMSMEEPQGGTSTGGSTYDNEQPQRSDFKDKNEYARALITWAAKNKKNSQQPTANNNNVVRGGTSSVEMSNKSEDNRARDAYEAAMNTAKNMTRTQQLRGFAGKLREGWQDRMYSLLVAQREIENQTGIKIADWENPYMYENQLSSINTAEAQRYEHEHAKPLLEEVRKLIKAGTTYDEVMRYVYAKHGLERNGEMAFKAAVQTEAANKEAGASRDEIKEWEKTIMAQYKTEKTKLEAMKAYSKDEAKYTADLEALRQRLAPDYENLKDKDYSGLTGLTAIKGEEYNENTHEFINANDIPFKERAEKLVSNFEANHNTSDLWKKINGATQAQLKKGFESGLLSREQYNNLKDMYRYYVPLRGFSEEVAEDVYQYQSGDLRHSKGSVFKSAAGRKSMADDPLATMFNNYDQAIVQANRNILRTKFYNMALNHPTSLLTVSNAWYTTNDGGETWTLAQPDLSEFDKKVGSAEDIANQVADFEEKMQKLSEKGLAQRGNTGLDINFKASKQQKSQHSVVVKVNGEEKIVYVNGNPRLAQAVNGEITSPSSKSIEDLMNYEIPLINLSLRKTNNFLAQSFTSNNPNFMLVNLVRDSQFSSMATFVREDSKFFRDFTKNQLKITGQIYKLVYKHEQGTLDMNNPTERYFKEFVDHGSETGYMSVKEVQDYRKNIERELADLSDNKVKAGFAKTKNVIRAAGAGFAFVNRGIEDVNRFATYLTARENGFSVEKSTEKAKNISVNFNRKGSGAYGASAARGLYLFLNAGVQALQNYTNLWTKTGTKGAIKMSIAHAIPIAASSMLIPVLVQALAAGMGDDPDKALQAYNELPDYIRRSNIVIYSGNGTFTMIPIAQEMRGAFGLGDVMYQHISGNSKHKNVGVELANQIMSIVPMNPMSDDFSGVPASVSPLVEAARNKNYFGAPIYYENEYNKEMPEFTKVNKGTPAILVKSSEVWNEFTGGNKYRKGSGDAGFMNPSIIWSLAQGYSGGVGKTALQVYSTGEGLLSKNAEVMNRNIPIWNRFVRKMDEYPVNGKVKEKFDFYHDIYDENMTEIRKLKKDKLVEKSDKLLEFLTSDEGKYFVAMKAVDKRIDRLAKQRKQADTPEEQEAINNKIETEQRKFINFFEVNKQSK